MKSSKFDWHSRYKLQAMWTYDLRSYIYERIHLSKANRVLDTGCGTGILLSEIASQSNADVFGLDINHEHLLCAQVNSPDPKLIFGNAHQLPFPDGNFDITLCHFLLLWVNSPQQVISEMSRVTRPGGVVIALAEPDYSGRIDYPDELSKLGSWQTESLRRQGADTNIGRSLSTIFHQAGLASIETGILGGQWTKSLSQDVWESEWNMLSYDFTFIPDLLEGVSELKKLDIKAWMNGERILYVPTFYAIGYVSEK